MHFLNFFSLFHTFNWLFMLLLLKRLAFKIKFEEICVCSYSFKQNEKSLAAHQKELCGPCAHLLRNNALDRLKFFNFISIHLSLRKLLRQKYGFAPPKPNFWLRHWSWRNVSMLQDHLILNRHFWFVFINMYCTCSFNRKYFIIWTMQAGNGGGQSNILACQ